MLNKANNEKGITLVELLATIAILSIIAALAYTVLFQGYSNYQRTKVETELRDEADLIMASLISDLFVSKKSEMQLVQACTNGTVDSYVKITKKNGSIYETGFKNKQVIVKGQPIQFSSKNVALKMPACTGTTSEVLKPIITSDNGVEYNIDFTLETIKRQSKFEKSFTNTIVVIND